MTITLFLIVAWAATVAVFLLARDRAEQRHAQERADDRSHVSTERQLLLNRIQAPDVAVAQVLTADDDTPSAVNPFSDQEYWALEMSDTVG